MTAHDMDAMVLKPVGVVRCAFASPGEVPVEGGPAIIEVHPEFGDGLEGIERSSHIVLLASLHRADRNVLMARPRKLDLGTPPCGVFASRAPVRPNPIGLTVVRLVARNGLRLSVDPLDLIDSTPILDIKSYAPGWDGVYAARAARRVPQSRLRNHYLLAFLQRELRNHMGALHAAPAAGIALAAVFMAIRALDVDARDPALRMATNRFDAGVDALMGLTGALLSEERLRVVVDQHPRWFRFEKGSHTMTLTVRQEEGFPSDPADWDTQGFVTTHQACH